MIPQPWTPDHAVDQALARDLIQARFPAESPEPLERVGFGWDMDVWRRGAIAFRFPRRKIAVSLVETEVRVLPGLAPHLPVRIPVPTHVGHASEAFPAPFYGHAFLPGTTLDRANPSEAERQRLAPVIGDFLRMLHGIGEAEAAAIGVPRDRFRGNMAAHAGRALARLAALPAGPWAAHASSAKALLDAPPLDREDGPDAMLHGDLYARHLLLDEHRELCGVIDWGDVCLGDPAVDLSIAYTLLGPTARPSFWAAYGQVDAATRQRARLVGLARYGIQLLAFALDVGDADLTREASLALTNAVS